MKISVDITGDKLAKLQAALTPEARDPVIERVGLRTFAEVVEKTPKRWFGQVRRSWQIQKPALGARVVINPNKIMFWLEEGTANKGQGYITPKMKKVLYIPLNRKAATGWNPSLVMGKDYILRKRVKGITPRLIAFRQAKKTREYLLEAMKEHIRLALA